MTIPSSLPSFRLDNNAIATETFSAEGEKVNKGGRKGRLILDNVDSSMRVAATIIKDTGGFFGFLNAISNFFNSYNCVVLTPSSGDKLLVNITSLAKRLHLTPEEITVAAEKDKVRGESGNFENLLREGVAKLKIDEERFIKYQERALAARISPQTLRKVLHIARRNLLHDGQERVLSTTSGASPAGKFIGKLEGDNLQLFDISTELGRGSFGVALKSIALHGASEEFAIKLVREDLGSEDARLANKDIINGYRKLVKIHKDGNVWGIEARPYRLIPITGLNRVGCKGRLYKGSAEKAESSLPTNKGLVRNFHQLLYGLNHLTKSNILHGDIKLQNSLVLCHY